ncbi:MAG: DJ-1/PfpI family protein [Alphaproteobacteria bacterium]|nr:DJ-1/PfpI family protein [Alphaproteobacteria bacterium]
MNSLSVCILLADGFEEAEAIIPADLLKRLGVKIIFAGVNSIDVRGTHNFHIKADNLIDNISSNDFDALILPGGLPGTINLRNSEKVINLVKHAYQNGKICAAICAAPIVLRDAGVATDKHITGYPNCEKLSYEPNFKFTGNSVERDGSIITAKGMGKANEFAFEIARALNISKEDILSVAKNTFIYE